MSTKEFFCYVLESTTCNMTYVGFTTDPHKRLRQHNGEIKGGAKYTRAGRPWKMVVYLTGFKTKTHALQTEWAIKKCKKISPTIKILSKSKNKHINLRVAKLFTVIQNERATAKAPLNSEQEYVVKFFDDRYPELESLVDNCVCCR
jgi:predicted GIY-YIG superfamily endonuclease